MGLILYYDKFVWGETYMEERLKKSLIMMIKLGENAEFWREARTAKYTPEEIQQLLAQYASDGMISWYVKKVEDKNFKTLENLLASDTIEKRIALLPYASKKFTEQIGEDVMQSGTLVEKYNYALKTPDRKYIKTRYEIFSGKNIQKTIRRINSKNRSNNRSNMDKKN